MFILLIFFSFLLSTKPLGEGQLTSIEASLCGQSRLSISSYGSTYSVPDVSLNNNMTIGPRRLSSAVVPTYHLSFMFSGLLHIIVVMTLHTDITHSTQIHIKDKTF